MTGRPRACDTSPRVAATILTLPRSRVLTDLLLEAPSGSVAPQELAATSSELVEELAPLARGLGASGLTIGPYQLVTALEQPERIGEQQDGFSPSPARCRRAIGLAAVQRCAQGLARWPQSSVAEVLGCALEDVERASRHYGAPRPPWWADWYASLSPAGRAVVQAEAITWATGLWSALEWPRLAGLVAVGGADVRWRLPVGGGSGIVLRARADVRVRCGDRQSLLVVASGVPRASWRAELAFPALVGALAHGERAAPARVVGLWPASGMVRTCEVDWLALAEAASAVVATASRYISASRSA